ncbi:hypothetical protein WN943_028919 [Citrus x changshan-huyou]
MAPFGHTWRPPLIVNSFNLRSSILSFNLGCMGCSTGPISIDLAKRLLQVYRHLSYAIIP